jgi:outer membrane protein OmpA-like peptidoglycan-associated protein
MMRHLMGGVLAFSACGFASAQTPAASCISNTLPLPQIFFDSGSSWVNADDVSLLKSWARAVLADTQCPLTIVFVSGFDDGARPPQAAQALSYQRARMVSRILLDAGVPKTHVAVLANGQNDVNGPAREGVEDAVWRRVDIAFGVHPSRQ